MFKTGADGLGYYKDTGQWRMESEETKDPLDPEYDMESHLRGDHQVRVDDREGGREGGREGEQAGGRERERETERERESLTPAETTR